MRSGKELILATKPYAVDYPLKSWWHVLSTTLFLAIAIFGTIWNFDPAGRIVCSVLAGFLILRLFVIYHDQQHQAILSKSRAANFLMSVFGILALSPTTVWSKSHNHHHNHNSRLRGSNIGSFPIMTAEQFLKSSRGVRAKYLFMRHPITILFGYVFIFLGGMCVFSFLDDRREHYDCLIALVLHALIGVLLTIEIFRCLRLKLWDVESQRMISLGALRKG